MFSGYSFFDYKNNIEGYAGQDYDSIGRWIYIIGTVILLFILLIVFRKAKRETVHKYLRVIGIFMCGYYLTKTIWESYYDISTGVGFNTSLLPFDTCSLIMPAAIIAGFAKGKVQKASEAWLVTGGIVGGIGATLFLAALKYYPFFTFGAFYSMSWHFIMLFTGLWMLVTHYVEVDHKTLLYGFLFHLACTPIVVIINYALGTDFMFYLRLGGLPLLEGFGLDLYNKGLSFLNLLIALALFFATFAIVTYATKGIQLLISSIKHKGNKTNPQGN